MKTELLQRLTQVQSRIESACLRSGRQSDEIQLIAVSKGQSSEKIKLMYELGVRDFGENYLQELTAKAAELKVLTDLRWHFIGGIQSNKIAKIVSLTSVIHTVSSYKHAELIASTAIKINKTQVPIFIEVNIGDETQKHGVALSETQSLADKIAQNLKNLLVLGVMAVPPREPSLALYENLKKLAPLIGQGQLSCGMSSDLEMAIEAGSTCIRIGRDLFGERS